MAGITSNVGLITGVPIQDLVDKLMSLAARPKDLLISRNAAAQQQQGALARIQSMTLALQVSAQKLVKAETFDAKKVTSTHDKILAARTTGTPVAGAYSFSPVRQAQTQQFLSTPFAGDGPLGEGTVSLRFGGFVDTGLALDRLNGGQGVQLGKIRITDRSGSSAEIDLRFAVTVDDVLAAINNSGQVQVTARAVGDHLELVDTSGQTAGNLRVQEVAGGRTAADLGLAGIDAAASSASGLDVLSLYGQLSLSQLNGGVGVAIRKGLPDLSVNFRDGSSLELDFESETSLGDLLGAINAADPARLRAELSADGDRLQLIDLTSGGGSFQVSSPLDGSLAENLGLTGPAAGGVITSSRLLGGLKTSLLRNLGGGAGLGSLGLLSLTDRSGATAQVNLSGSQTLDEVVQAVNAAGLGISASINEARNGLVLRDTTGASASHLIVANGDGTNTADKLRLAANVAGSSVNSGSLDLQVIGEQTLLSALNGGKGIFRNTILLTDTQGNSASVRLIDPSYQTLGDLIRGINNLGLGIEARINEAGDGLMLVDTAGGAGVLDVRDVGSGRAAQELRIRGQGTLQTVGGVSQLAINGSTTLQVTLDADDTLQDLVQKLNDLQGGFKASSLNLGTGGSRLTLVSERSGQAGALLVDTHTAGFSLRETVKAQDALLAFGNSAEGAHVLIPSASNDFDNVVPGLQLSLLGTQLEPVTITVENSSTELMDTVKKFVADYNKLIDELSEQSKFNEADGSSGPLFGTTEILRIESDFARLLSGPVTGAGRLRSFEEIGLSFDGRGKLVLNEQKLSSKYATDPGAIKDFFLHEKTGAAVRLNELIDQTAGTPKVNGVPQGTSLLDARTKALQQRIDTNQLRIDNWNVRLENQRELLLKQFFHMETAVSKLKASMSQLSRIQPLAIGTGSGSSS